jgi:hypothetical protein
MTTADGNLSVNDDPKAYILSRYQEAINYYWHAGRSNKRAYRNTRYLVVVLGATVTLVASLASANFVKSRGWLDVSFAIATPVLAAVLAIVGGVAQTFQWGASWREMVLSAAGLEARRDNIAVAEDSTLDLNAEMVFLHKLQLSETRGFFDRILGRSSTGLEDS